MTPHLFSFSSQRLKLDAAAWGDVRDPLVILVHGGRDQKHAWDWTAARLAEAYYVVAYDLRGHGGSDWVNDGDYGVMDHVYDLASLIDHLGRRSLILIGHSLGGNIVLRYCGLYPERVEKLVAIEGLGPSPKLLAERSAKPVDERLRDWIDRRREESDRSPKPIAGIADAMKRMLTVPARLSDEQRRHLAETGTRPHDPGPLTWCYDPAGLGPSPSDIAYDDFKALIGRISSPTLLLYGARSWASNPAEDGRIGLFSNSPDLKVINEAGHWLQHEQFEVFMAEIERFLSG